MDDSKTAHDDIGDHQNFLDFTHKDEFCSQNFLANLMKHSLLLGADKLLMARKPEPAQLSDFEPQTDNAPNYTFKSSKIRGEKYANRKSVLKLGVRFGKACICAVFVFFVLVGLLVSGFAIGGVIMRNLVEESVIKNEILNFDYTKTSPVAVVPISSSLVNGVINSKYQTMFGSENQGQRAIPYNHKLKVTVSLTLPESEYNRKLGVFQVRVETLSANGNPILGSSYPTMLRFKSQPIRIVETLFNSVPLITGLKSEVQNLKIVMGDFNEGYEPTSFFKVILEQRAEFQAGSGVPEIYAASLEISSELPKLKRVLWSWRRTIFVWISFGVFMAEITVFLIFFRAVIFPGGKPKGVGSKKKYKIPGQKGI
ncbi:hypothetical protein DH2020_033750 [Rehmannia glutinosa]|uniref:Seipin n=1 Tax=Rehmannia glutinosa TaxID=99300 RepID=A0ABR0VDY0_REHGL